jgi:CDP-4-dehydro-6-deoxyglucose reductase/ferredoxin-NAD(P)+ reductase (naphthalene dioxygenase ferredoxin-specific)
MSTNERKESAAHLVRTLSCRVLALARPARGITVVRLEVLSGGPFAFSAGQYARVAFPDQPPRDYSLANRPDEPVLEFHIRDNARAGAGAAPFDRLARGDRATVEGPFGEGWLRQAHAGPILAVAGGSGIAPVKAIVETALAKGMRQDIRLYHGVCTEADLYLEGHFQALARAHSNFRFTPVLSHPEGGTDRRTGLVSDAVAEDFARLSAWTAYLAGPPAMVAATVGVLTARGMDRADIHSDEHIPAPS